MKKSDFWKTASLLDLHLKVLKFLAQEFNWNKYKINKLLRRIQKIGRNSTKFSARDTKLLKKFINKQKKQGYIDFEEIAFNFPGKFIQILETHYSEKQKRIFKIKIQS